MRRQQRLAMILSGVSPFGAVSYTTMDLARTGFVQHEEIEQALGAYLIYLSAFVYQKRRQTSGSVYRDVDMHDFSWFAYRNNETVWDCLSRNMLHILGLALLAILGFAGAYVSIVRYDVR